MQNWGLLGGCEADGNDGFGWSKLCSALAHNLDRVVLVRVFHMPITSSDVNSRHVNKSVSGQFTHQITILSL